MMFQVKLTFQQVFKAILPYILNRTVICICRLITSLFPLLSHMIKTAQYETLNEKHITSNFKKRSFGLFEGMKIHYFRSIYSHLAF